MAEKFSELQAEVNWEIEVIMVNDSPFYLETSGTLNQLEAQYPFIKVIQLRRNQGQQIALLVGIERAKGDYVVTMDDDLQHPVEEIPKLLDAIQQDEMVDAIFAVPSYRNKKHNFWRNVASFLANKIDTVFLKKPKGLIKSAFRIMTRDLAKTIVRNYNSMPAISSLIIHSTNNIKNIEVNHNSREFGRSNYTFTKLFTLMLNNLIHYSSLPLKALGLVGVLVFFASVGFVIFIVCRKLLIGTNYPGYASTVSLISFFGGLNLLALGLIGEYLIRIIREQQKSNLEDLIKKSNK